MFLLRCSRSGDLSGVRSVDSLMSLAADVEAQAVELSGCLRLDDGRLRPKVRQTLSHDVPCVLTYENECPSVPVDRRQTGLSDDISRACEIIDKAFEALTECSVNTPIHPVVQSRFADGLSACEIIDNAYEALAERVFCSRAFPSVQTNVPVDTGVFEVCDDVYEASAENVFHSSSTVPVGRAGDFNPAQVRVDKDDCSAQSDLRSSTYHPVRTSSLLDNSNIVTACEPFIIPHPMQLCSNPSSDNRPRAVQLAADVEAQAVELSGCLRLDDGRLRPKVRQTLSHDVPCVLTYENECPSVPVDRRQTGLSDDISRACEIIDKDFEALTECSVNSPIHPVVQSRFADGLSACEIIDNAYEALAERVFCSRAFPSVQTNVPVDTGVFEVCDDVYEASAENVFHSSSTVPVGRAGDFYPAQVRVDKDDSSAPRDFRSSTYQPVRTSSLLDNSNIVTACEPFIIPHPMQLNSQSPSCDKPRVAQLNSQSPSCDKPRVVQLNSQSPSDDKSPVAQLNSQSPSFDKPRVTQLNSQSPSCDRPRVAQLNSQSPSCDKPRVAQLNSQSPSCDKPRVTQLNSQSPS